MMEFLQWVGQNPFVIPSLGGGFAGLVGGIWCLVEMFRPRRATERFLREQNEEQREMISDLAAITAAQANIAASLASTQLVDAHH